MIAVEPDLEPPPPPHAPAKKLAKNMGCNIYSQGFILGGLFCTRAFLFRKMSVLCLAWCIVFQRKTENPGYLRERRQFSVLVRHATRRGTVPLPTWPFPFPSHLFPGLLHSLTNPRLRFPRIFPGWAQTWTAGKLAKHD